MHELEEELYYILEGEIDAYVGNEAFKVGTGECPFLPQLKPRVFVIRSARYRMLVLARPSPLDSKGTFAR